MSDASPDASKTAEGDVQQRSLVQAPEETAQAPPEASANAEEPAAPESKSDAAAAETPSEAAPPASSGEEPPAATASEPAAKEDQPATSDAAPPAAASEPPKQGEQESSPAPDRPQEDSAPATPAATAAPPATSTAVVASPEQEGDDRQSKVRFDAVVSYADVDFERSPASAAEADVCERLYIDGRRQVAERVRLHEEAKANRVEEGIEEATFKPKIYSETIEYEDFDQFYQVQCDWTKRRGKLFAEKVKKYNSEEEEKMPFTPNLQKRSEKIVKHMAKSGKYKGSQSSWGEHFDKFVAKNQGDKLAMTPRRAATPNSRARQAAAEDDRRAFTPKINAQSKKLAEEAAAEEPSQAIFDKLYQDSVMRDTAKRIVAQTKAEHDARELFHPMTNETLWDDIRFNSNGDAYTDDGLASMSQLSFKRSPNEVVESLLLKGDEYKYHREELARRFHDKDNTHTFKPKTNKHSRRLVAEFSKRAPPPAISNIERELQLTLDEGVKGVKDPNAKTAVFDVDLFCSRMERSEANKMQRLEAIRRENELSEASSCTFRPSITKQSERVAAKAQIYRSSGNSAAVVPNSAAAAAGRFRNEGVGAAATDSMRRRRLEAYHQAQARRGSSRSPPRPVAAASVAPPSASARSQRVASKSRQLHQQQPPMQQQRPSVGNNSSPPTARTFFDDGQQEEAYLANLESELRGVIADWQNISI